MGLNIRVIKITDVPSSNSFLKKDKVVFLTEGYEGSIDDCDKKIVANFCPFCGSSLSYLTANDDFVQEFTRIE